jgi:archaetidylinositol phosphate synthase
MGNEARETRIQGSVLAAVEKRVLVWIAERLPRWVNSDHLTALGAVAMAGAGICYTFGRQLPAALVAVVALLAVNWFGDSLDGTLARVRRQERPRYGFYVDHVLDALGILFLMAGLIVGGYMGLAVGGGLLIAYYLLTIEIALATYALGTFRISYWRIGPTELRILLALGTLQLLRSDSVVIAGQRWLLFDLGGAAGIAGLAVTFISAAIANARELYRREPLPPPDRQYRGQLPTYLFSGSAEFGGDHGTRQTSRHGGTEAISPSFACQKLSNAEIAEGERRPG